MSPGRWWWRRPRRRQGRPLGWKIRDRRREGLDIPRLPSPLSSMPKDSKPANKPADSPSVSAILQLRVAQVAPLNFFFCLLRSTRSLGVPAGAMQSAGGKMA